MRYYVLGAAALALSGLGEIFLGVNGAPTSLSQARDPFNLEHGSISTGLVARVGGPGEGGGKGGDPGKDDPGKDDPTKDDPTKGDPGKDDPTKDDGSGSKGGPKTYQPKPVPDVFAQNSPYTYDTAISSPIIGTTYTVSVKNPAKPGDAPVKIDTIAVKTTKGASMISVKMAENKDLDPIDKNDPSKEFLSDIMMALWNKVEGKSPTDLVTTKFETVIEEGTLKAINAAASILDIDLSKEPISVKSSAADGSKEQGAFDMISGKDPKSESVFGPLTERIIQEFSVGKQIVQIDVDTSKTLTITLG